MQEMHGHVSKDWWNYNCCNYLHCIVMNTQIKAAVRFYEAFRTILIRSVHGNDTEIMKSKPTCILAGATVGKTDSSKIKLCY